MSTVHHISLYDMEAFAPKQVAELTAVLMDKVGRVGWDGISVDEQVQCRLILTLLDGFADPRTS
jgi:hypothetical protein